MSRSLLSATKRWFSTNKPTAAALPATVMSVKHNLKYFTTHYLRFNNISIVLDILMIHQNFKPDV